MSKVIQQNVFEVMPKSYTEYAVDVIKNRALADVRDGLKPVHRRILYSMYELGLTPDKGYRKCARIVGDVLGKYHPHGDSSVYDALVRMAQDFSIRYTLVDGHGNFGSIDGDSPAQLRYTEAKMNKITLEMLRDINKNTVDFIPNFDGEEKEPSVLPSRFPNLLVNGCEGIAVGFASKMPPHNLSEVIDGIIYRIDNNNCNTKDLLNFIKSPDFPTGANIINPQDMIDIYEKGEGKITIRSSHTIETVKIKNKEKTCIIFTDVPYQVNKARLVEDIYNGTKATKKKLKGKEQIIPAKFPNIETVRDESNREGIRIVVVLKKKDSINEVLSQLFKETKLQTDYSVNNTALVNNLPVEHLSLKKLIDYYINFQKEVIIKKTQFEKGKAEKNIHILKGLKIAIDNLDITIKLIRQSKNKNEAKEQLIEKLNIDDLQADSILQMQLQRLTNLEQDNLIMQINELISKITYYTSILDNENELNKVLKTDLIEIKNKYGDKRKTKLLYNASSIDNTSTITDYNCKIFYTKYGYIKKTLKSSENHYMKEDDIAIEEIISTNKSILYLFTNKANRYKLPCYLLDDKKPSNLGEYIPNIIDLEPDEQVIKIVSIEDETKLKGHIISVYENGKIAKVDMESFMSTTKKLVNCYSSESKLIGLSYIEKDTDVLMVSSEGRGLIVNTSYINSKKTRITQGNIAMRLNDKFEDNKVIGCIIDPKKDKKVIIKTEKGNRKEFFLDDVAPTDKPNEERGYYEYMTGRNGNGGNFIYNCRHKKDRIVELM